jgi:ABC-2 type transport system ATP-binding protein
MTAIIQAEGVVKRFGKTTALAGLDLVAESGRVLALLGPNGAGKTTFVRTVATLVQPDEGHLRVGGLDVVDHPHDVRRMIGLAGQYAAVEEAMTGVENLVMVARLFGQDRKTAKVNAARVLDQLGLTDAGGDLVRTYSGGMRRKLDLGASLVGAPRLLLLDEPTTGLDPRSRVDLWEAIRGLVASGTDVLLTTQYLDEADQLANEIVIVDHGRVIAAGTPGELKERAGRDVVEAHVRDAGDLARVAEAFERITDGTPIVDQGTRRVTMPVTNGTEELMAGLRALDEAGIALDDIGLRRPTLDEVFLSLTGKPLDDDVQEVAR